MYVPCQTLEKAYRICASLLAFECMVLTLQALHWTWSDEVYESGAALAPDMGVTVLKMQDSIVAHTQASLITEQDPDGGPFPAYLSGKSWDEASGKTGSGKKFYHNVISGADFAFCREKWPVHGGQLQLHRNKGDLQGFELHCGQRPGKCHGIQGRVHSRRASSDVGSGTATCVCRHWGRPVLVSTVAFRCTPKL